MKIFISTLSILLINYSLFAQIGIGTTSPHNSSVLELESSKKGFLPPRMTKVQMFSINNPAEGLIVYCTNCCSDAGSLYFYNSIEWNAIFENCDLTLDSDLDGIVDSVDIDDDNDGILDVVENTSNCSTCSINISNSNNRDNMFSWIVLPVDVQVSIAEKYKIYTGYVSAANSRIAEQYDAKLGSGLMDDLSSSQTCINAITVDNAHLDPFAKNHYFESNFKTKTYSDRYVLHEFIGYKNKRVTLRISDDNWNSFTCLSSEMHVNHSNTHAKLNASPFELKSNTVYSLRFYFHDANTTYSCVSGGLADDIYLSGKVITSNPTPCPTVLTVVDTDNDGIVNSLDLDSDGDGCPDLIEAQVDDEITATDIQTSIMVNSSQSNIPNSQVVGPYYLNGFSSKVVTFPDTNNYKGTYNTNEPYNNTINNCTP